MNRAQVPLDPREEALVQACKRVVKVTYKIKSATATENDKLLMLDGEVTIRKLLPSLNLADTHTLAHYIVDIASWSLRHLLGTPLPEVATQEGKGTKPVRAQIQSRSKEPNPFSVDDRVVNTMDHDRNYHVEGTIVSVRGLNIEVRYDKVLHLDERPLEPKAWPVGTVGRSAHFLWRPYDQHCQDE